MKAFFLNVMAGLLLLVFPAAAAAEESSLSEKEVPSLAESDLSAIVKKEDCIVMYYSSDKSENDAEARRTYGISAQRLADEWMRSLLVFQRQEALTLKLYKVNWKGMSPETVMRIRRDTGSLYKAPESPSFVSYIDAGTGIFAIPGPARPDRLSWFVNEMLAHSIATLKTAKGEFMRGPGWLFTDTKAKYISLVGVRKGILPGSDQDVRIVDYASTVFNGYACTYESFYSRSGGMLGIIESCGKSGRVGYFDRDRAGRMQYRVRYRTEETTSGTQQALPAK
jgi:hypothetical protein